MTSIDQLKKTARIAGFLYLSLIPLGIFGILYVPSNIIVEGDIETTVRNIISNESLFRLSILSALIIQVIQIFLVFYLYELFKEVNRIWAIILVLMILPAVPIAMLNEVNNFAVLLLLENPEESLSQISFFLDLHNRGIIIAQLFWGLWLFPMGYLAYKSGFIPKIIGILLMIGCFGYLVDSILFTVLPDFKITFSEYTSIGEFFMAFWLVIKGVRTPSQSNNK